MPEQGRLHVAGEVVHLQMHIAGQEVPGAQRDQAHRDVRPGEDLRHHTHGPVAAAGQDDVGPGGHGRPRLRKAGVLRGGFKDARGRPAGVRTRGFNQAPGLGGPRLDGVQDHGNRLTAQARAVGFLPHGKAGVLGL